MKAKIYSSLLFICLYLCQSYTYSQCTDATHGHYPDDTYINEECAGVPETINEFCYAGEFSSVYLMQGYTYEFSSSIATDYLTILFADENLVLASGTSPVTYQSTFTGVVDFFTHVSSACDESEDYRARIVSCLAPEPCLNAALGQYPAQAFTSTVCDGLTEETIEFDCATGEYSKVNLTAGNTYVFSSSEPADYITISDENGVSALVYDFSPVEYIATTNQVVRFYLHGDVNCDNDGGFRSRIVTCGPTFCHSDFQWPQDTYTMTACDGTTELINSDAFAGEYALVNMEMNKTYVLSSSVATDYITVASADGLSLITRGYTPLTFVPVTSGQYQFIIYADSLCAFDGEVERNRNISCSGPLGLEEAEVFNLNIYPNPTTNQLTISADEKMEEIQIFSIDGKLLLTTTPTSLSTTLSLENFQSGTYFLRATIRGGIVTKEVIKQ